ncbi:hypothetical protein DPMN_137812 [Dreissena polymorpha]|uniref:Uncharacterized protein n=1 Tax=Dreissena polymorpha TaxID=45954 RepID=A0A9D4G660_DREPO|nr:hypothetical protein DPMN_137812 [Dreissena polymorpha]
MAHKAATAHWLMSLTGLYTWVERSKRGINLFLTEKSSGLGGIRIMDLTIP